MEKPATPDLSGQSNETPQLDTAQDERLVSDEEDGNKPDGSEARESQLANIDKTEKKKRKKKKQPKPSWIDRSLVPQVGSVECLSKDAMTM